MRMATIFRKTHLPHRVNTIKALTTGFLIVIVQSLKRPIFYFARIKCPLEISTPLQPFGLLLSHPMTPNRLSVTPMTCTIPSTRPLLVLCHGRASVCDTTAIPLQARLRLGCKPNTMFGSGTLNYWFKIYSPIPILTVKLTTRHSMNTTATTSTDFRILCRAIGPGNKQ